MLLQKCICEKQIKLLCYEQSFLNCLLMNISIQLQYWYVSSLIDKRIALVLPGGIQLTP